MQLPHLSSCSVQLCPVTGDAVTLAGVGCRQEMTLPPFPAPQLPIAPGISSSAQASPAQAGWGCQRCHCARSH